MTEESKELKYGPVVARVTSKSSPDKVYEVRRKDRVYSCNCKGWIFSKDQPRRCRHTDAALRMECYVAVEPTRRAAAVRRRAGVGEKKTRDQQVVEQVLTAGGINIATVLPGAMMRMVGAIAPYLNAAQQTVQPVVPVRDPGEVLIGNGPRLITLED